MKTGGGMEVLTPRILNLDTRWRWELSFTPRSLYLRGKGSRYALDRRMDGAQSRSGRGGVEKKSLPCPCRESSPEAYHYTDSATPDV